MAFPEYTTRPDAPPPLTHLEGVLPLQLQPPFPLNQTIGRVAANVHTLGTRKFQGTDNLLPAVTNFT